jgi:hypothetical protein
MPQLCQRHVRNDKPFDGDKAVSEEAAVNAARATSSVRLASFRDCQGHFLHAVLDLQCRRESNGNAV